MSVRINSTMERGGLSAAPSQNLAEHDVGVANALGGAARSDCPLLNRLNLSSKRLTGHLYSAPARAHRDLASRRCGAGKVSRLHGGKQGSRGILLGALCFLQHADGESVGSGDGVKVRHGAVRCD